MVPNTALSLTHAPNSDSGIGLLQDEQFNAIQRFWTDVVQNPKVTNNVIGQDAWFCQVTDDGSVLRSPNDSYWGIWQPCKPVHTKFGMRFKCSLAKYGSNIDIIFDNPAYPTVGALSACLLLEPNNLSTIATIVLTVALLDSHFCTTEDVVRTPSSPVFGHIIPNLDLLLP